MKPSRHHPSKAALIAALVLIGAFGTAAGAQIGKPPAAPPAAVREGVRFDRVGFAEEMTRLSGDPKSHPTEALQAHARRLTELYAALETASGLTPSERQAMGESILGRVAQVGLILRQRQGGRPEEAIARSSGKAWTAYLPNLGDLGAALFDGPALLLGLLGGVVIAFALGGLAGYRRGATQASYYGSVGDPRIRFLVQGAGQGENGRGPSPMSVTQIRDMLARGRTVMLQLGYEVKPTLRPRYLELIGKMQDGMRSLDGQSYTVWEDPRHPNRFYELLICIRPGALDRLLARDWRLAEIAAEIEACRTPHGPVFRRAWWELQSTPPSPAARKS
jgi:hypothetical protein